MCTTSMHYRLLYYNGITNGPLFGLAENSFPKTICVIAYTQLYVIIVKDTVTSYRMS